MSVSLNHASSPPSRPKKRLIVCCDGTWQASDKTYGITPSNIAKLSRMIDREDDYKPDLKNGHNNNRKADGVIPQVVYYQSGVGTGTTGALAVGFEGSVGMGLSENVSTAYHYLSTNFHAADEGGNFTNDEIFLFGFSRGAYTARVLCGLVTEMGLLKAQQLHDFPRAFEIYKKLSKMAAKRTSDGDPFDHWMDYYAGSLNTSDRDFWHGLRVKAKMHGCWNAEKSRFENNVKIKAIGVWDTVGALGVPDSLFSRMFPIFSKPFQFQNTGLNTNIENAFQALALDEHRGAFPPTLWYLPKTFLDKPNCPNLKQCWFPGFHDSIGGGGAKFQTLATEWFPKLMDWLMPDTSQMHEVTLAWMCDQVDGLLRFDKQAVQDILLQDGKTRGNWAACQETDMAKVSLGFFDLPIVGGSHTRKPGQYHIDLTRGQTNETMHPSVYYRTKQIHRLDYTGRPLQERHVWAYSTWMAQFHFNVAMPLGFLRNLLGLFVLGLWCLGAPIRVLTPSLWSYFSEFWEVFEIFTSAAVELLTRLGELATNSPLTFIYLDRPLWNWQALESKKTEEHEGARWVRRKVPPSVFLQDGQKEIRIQEWVIRDSADEINFEKAIIPDKVWNDLEWRNGNLIRQAKKAPDYRTQFWTRTEWDHRDDPPKEQSKLRAHKSLDRTLIRHPLHEFHDIICKVCDDAHVVDEATDTIKSQVSKDLRKVHGDLHHISRDVQYGVQDAVDITNAALGKAVEDAEATRQHVHDEYHNPHNAHDHSLPGKKNKKHAKHQVKNEDDENLFNGGAVQTPVQGH